MDFAISPSIQEHLQTVRRFVREELMPLESEFLKKPFTQMLPALEKKRQQVRDMNLWAPQIPKEFGGCGLDFMEHAMISEELGRCPLGHFAFNCQAPDSGNMEILIEFGTKVQIDAWLRPLAAGRIRSCFAMTEPECAGSNPVWMKTTAVADGDSYVINGHKWFSSSADGAQFAIVMAVTDPIALPHNRASQIIVPTDAPGFKLIRNIPVMGHTGDGWASHAELRFENVRVPTSNLLGSAGEGFAIAQARLGPGRIHHCMRWIGMCERAFDEMCRYAARRELAPGDRLGTRQTVQNWIAESRAEINAARLMVLHAAWRIDNVGQKEAREEVSVIKFFVADVLMKVVDRAIQVHGALGVSDDTILSHFFRSERAARIYDGPDEVHKTVVAKRVLNQYGIKT